MHWIEEESGKSSKEQRMDRLKNSVRQAGRSNGDKKKKSE
jgi:hypothetical protein